MGTIDYYDVEICMLEHCLDFYDTPLTDSTDIICNYQKMDNRIKFALFNQPLLF